MSWFNNKAQPKEEPLFPFPSIEEFSSEHVGVMASPNYCNSLDCWCHTDSGYHDAVTSLPVEAAGDKAFQAFSQFLDDDGEFLSDVNDGSYTIRRW